MACEGERRLVTFRTEADDVDGLCVSGQGGEVDHLDFAIWQFVDLPYLGHAPRISSHPNWKQRDPRGETDE
jgi:hypothetical protein